MHSMVKKDHVRMHDIVRDVALQIASKENHTTVVNLEKVMNVLPEYEPIKNCYALTSWCRDTIRIPRQLDAPKVGILLLTTERSIELSDATFKSMKELRVVGILLKYRFCNSFLSLPPSISYLTNLRTLRLQGWELGDDISWILGLRRLEILDLKYSLFNELPKRFEELKKLKLLDLSGCEIKEQSYKVIERCTQLEELYVHRVLLTRTTSKFNKYSSQIDTFPKLWRYVLGIGKLSDYDEHQCIELMDPSSKTLTLAETNISSLSLFTKDLLQRAETVCLVNPYGGCKNIVPDVIHGVGGMNELMCLVLFSYSNFECLIDATSHQVDLLNVETLFSKLTKLRLKLLSNLKEVWRGPPLVCFFEKLQELYISECPMLTSLFPKCVAKSVLLLQKLTIEYCHKLKNIIEMDGISIGEEIFPISDNPYLVFSHLKILTICSCGQLEYIFSNSCVQGTVQLEEVCIERASKLKYVFGQHEDEHQEVQIQYPALKSLTLKGLKNLLSIFPKNYHSSCPSLKKLNWVECPKFIVSCVNIEDNQLHSRALATSSFLNLNQLEIGDCGAEDILFPLERVGSAKIDSHKSVLNILKLRNVSELKFVWSGQAHTLNLQNLREITMSACNNMKIIFPPVIVRGIQLLERLYVYNCDQLEEIISDINVEEHNQNLLNALPQHMYFPKLKRLQVKRCNKLKCLFSMAVAWDDLPELQYLYVTGAAKLEHVFRGKAKPAWQNSAKEIILPKLKALDLEGVPSLKEFCQGLSLFNEFLPQNVRTTQVPSLMPAVLNAKSLESLSLGSLPELGWTWISPSQISNLLYLQRLELRECNKLKSVFSKVSHGISLPMLWSLTLVKCEELEEIMREDQEFHTYFPKLTELRVEHCNKLKCVLSASSFTRLTPHLQTIRICECEKLEEVFRHKSEASSEHDKEIVLPNLRYTKLEKLPSLVNVFKGFKLYAGNIVMRECPKFSSIMGVVGSIVIYVKETKPHAKNCNQLPDHGPYFFPIDLHLTKLELQKLSELSSISTALTSSQILSFQYLQELTVRQCGKLKCIFSTVIHGSLQDLSYLNIWECEEVKEIIEELEEADHLSNPNLHFSFPKLETLVVKECNKLKYLFKASRVGMLPKLKYIEVSWAAQMEELFSHKSEGATIDTSEIALPNLQQLQLEELPSLTHFCKDLKLNAPYLRDVKINECPQFDLVLTEIEENSIQPNTQGILELEESGEGISSAREK